MIEVKNGTIYVYEYWGGSRGSNYFYIKDGEQLVHISKKFKGVLRGATRGGRRKKYVYKIPLAELELYEFSFSNSGYGPYCRRYLISQNGNVIEKVEVDLADLEFEVVGSENGLLRFYNSTVPKMIERVKQIEKSLGIGLLFDGTERLEDIYRDPARAAKIALVFPTAQTRCKALEKYIQDAHELYVLMLVAEAIGGKTIYHVLNGQPIWWIAHAKDWPTAVVDNSKRYTIWYQFSIIDWLKVVFPGIAKAFLNPAELQRLAMEGKFEIFEKIFGVKPKDVREAYSLIANWGEKRRQHVKPDIVIFKGDYRERNEIKADSKVIVIDAKVEIKNGDLVQLKGYMKTFRQFKDVKFIIACLGRAKYKTTLERMGYIVIENVAPNESGENKFKEVLLTIL